MGKVRRTEVETVDEEIDDARTKFTVNSGRQCVTSHKDIPLLALCRYFWKFQTFVDPTHKSQLSTFLKNNAHQFVVCVFVLSMSHTSTTHQRYP